MSMPSVRQRKRPLRQGQRQTTDPKWLISATATATATPTTVLLLLVVVTLVCPAVLILPAAAAFVVVVPWSTKQQQRQQLQRQRQRQRQRKRQGVIGFDRRSWNDDAGYDDEDSVEPDVIQDNYADVIQDNYEDDDKEESGLKRKRSNYWVLLVDDEYDIRSAVGSFLSDSGFKVTTCEDAYSAWNIVTDHSLRRPDLIISDVRMPGMDGIEFLNRLRDFSSTKGMPVVLLTAKGQTQDRVAGYNAGADAYIPKPFDPQELVTVVDNLLEKQKLWILPDVSVQELQHDVREIKRLLLEQGGGGVTPVPGFVQKDKHRGGVVVFLAPDEQQVLELLCQGKINKEIAQATYLSTRRVEQLLTRMFRKAGVSNRTELVRWAIASGHVRV